MKLSIIICIYNTPREYLRALLESIVFSTLEKYQGEYEICIVDDGSSIDYSDLVQKFGARYQKTENQGILKARLCGIEMARGEYIAFCDSDDTVSSFYYSPMLDEAEKSGADIVINDWAYHAGDQKYYCKNDIAIKNDIDASGSEVIKLFFSGEGKHHSLFVLWNKIYRAQLLKSAKEQIEKSGQLESSYGEDVLINFLAWREAKSVKNIHRGYYFYRIHKDQAVNASSVDKLKNQIKSMAEALDFMENELSLNQSGDALTKASQSDELIACLNSWRELNARYHYTVAYENGYTALYDFILEKYKQKTLEFAKKEDSVSYFHKIYLGDNFDEIDSALLFLWQNGIKNVRYKVGNRYIDSAISYLIENKKITVNKKTEADFYLPRRKVSLKNRLRFNPAFYKLSLVLFKKNSKLRTIIKNKF